jgi:hypothetical protein
MPQPRKYASNAERQRAYRARQKGASDVREAVPETPVPPPATKTVSLVIASAAKRMSSSSKGCPMVVGHGVFCKTCRCVH